MLRTCCQISPVVPVRIPSNFKFWGPAKKWLSLLDCKARNLLCQFSQESFASMALKSSSEFFKSIWSYLLMSPILKCELGYETNVSNTY